MQPRYWSRAWKTGGWITRLSGLTSEPSTLDHGVEAFIASLRETHASPTVSQGADVEQPTTDGSSTKFSELSMKRGLIVSSARTCRGMQTDNSPLSFLDWKDWATAVRSEYSARRKSAPAIDGNGCSSWPTARTSDTNGAGSHELLLTGQAEAMTWASPRASDGEKGGPNMSFGAGGTPLPTMAARFEQKAWGTPTTRDWKDGDTTGMDVPTNGLLGRQVVRDFPSSPPAPTIPDGPPSSKTPRTLNPLFVEWMHGWPIGWTAFEPVETASQVWLLRMRGALSTLCSATTAHDLFADTKED
jgi:hypothetical protein